MCSFVGRLCLLLRGKPSDTPSKNELEDEAQDSPPIKLQMIIMDRRASKCSRHHCGQQSPSEIKMRGKQCSTPCEGCHALQLSALLQLPALRQSNDTSNSKDKYSHKFASHKELCRIHQEEENTKTFALCSESLFDAVLRNKIHGKFTSVIYKTWQGICQKEYASQFFCLHKGFLGLKINGKDDVLMPTIDNYTNIMAWDLWKLNEDGVFEVISMWIDANDVPNQWALESLDYTFKPGAGMIGRVGHCEHWDNTVNLSDDRNFHRSALAKTCGITSGDAFRFNRGAGEGETFVIGYYTMHPQIQNCHVLKENLEVIE